MQISLFSVKNFVILQGYKAMKTPIIAAIDIMMINPKQKLCDIQLGVTDVLYISIWLSFIISFTYCFDFHSKTHGPISAINNKNTPEIVAIKSKFHSINAKIAVVVHINKRNNILYLFSYRHILLLL